MIDLILVGLSGVLAGQFFERKMWLHFWLNFIAVTAILALNMGALE